MQWVCSALMSKDREQRARGPESSYRVYRSGSKGITRPDRPAAATDAGREAGKGRSGGRSNGSPYSRYHTRPRGLIARLRAESDWEILQRESARPRGKAPVAPDTRPWWRRWTWKRGLIAVVTAVLSWVLLSTVLFLISAQIHVGDLPAGAGSQLTGAGPILTSPNTVLILGLDNRPTSGSGSKEPGSNYSEADANTDSIMLWRIGDGVSRRLSIPRDTLVDIPGVGFEKINAAWSDGGPALALKVIKQFTGLEINHLIVVDLANFPKFINDIGGVTVTTPRICSQIAGGVADGGFTLDLSPGSHHLNGLQALILARTRDNSCNTAYTDLNREAMQQEIMNGIKSQLFSLPAFLHLPWAAWDAPGVIQTDMGGLTLMQLFIASEIGGSAPASLLTESSSSYDGSDVLLPNQANVKQQVAKLLNG